MKVMNSYLNKIPVILREVKKYTKKMNKKPKEMFINNNQDSEIKLEDSVTNCAKSWQSDPNICVVQTADGQTAQVKMCPPLRKYENSKLQMVWDRDDAN